MKWWSQSLWPRWHVLLGCQKTLLSRLQEEEEEMSSP